MTRPLISFVAIFKDESVNVRRTLESVRPFVDRWTVLDTGSADGTQDIVREVMRGLPGDLYEEPFVDFATTRNRSIELEAGRAEFLLILSADEILENGIALREYLMHLSMTKRSIDGGYCVTVANSYRRWPSVRVIRSDGGWKYAPRKIHERLQGPKGEGTGPLIPKVTIIHAESDLKRKITRMREYDLPILKAEVAGLVNTDKEDELASAVWDLAQTHEALAATYPPKVSGREWMEHKLAAMSLYRRRMDIGTDQKWSAYAWLCSLKIADELSFIYTNEELIRRLKIIIELNPKLPEAYYMLACVEAREDARKGLFLAKIAASTSNKLQESFARGDFEGMLHPVDLKIGAAALALATACAAQLGEKVKAHKLAAEAIAAGGPKEQLEKLLRGL